MVRLFGYFARWFAPWFGKIFEYITGFMGFCGRVFREWFSRKVKDRKTRLNMVSSPAYGTAVFLMVGTIFAGYFGLLSVLVQILIKIFDLIEKSQRLGSSSSGSGVGISLFYDVLNTLRVMEVFHDTFVIWFAGFLVPFLAMLASIAYYKVIFKSFQKAKDFLFYGKK